MAIRAGQFLHSSNGFVIDRIQTGGPSSLNIPQEKIYELGNYQSVATVRDIPELSFEMESTDVSTEVEALLLGKTPSSITNGQQLDFINSIPLDIISPFKSAYGAYDIVKGVVVPYLTLDSVTYRMGVKANATQSFTLRGDSIFYTPGSPYFEEFTITSGTNQPYSLAHTAQVYTESGDTIYALSVCAKNPTSGAYKRLFYGTDYTNTSTTVTTLANLFTLGYTKLHVTYSSATAATYGTGVHEGVSVKPAAVRAKDINVYVSDGAATPTLLRWTGVQSFEVTRKVNLENNEEFGNSKYVSIDYDVPDVTGSIVVRSVDPADLWAKIAQIANVSTSVVTGPYSSSGLEVEVQVADPDTGTILKSFVIPDARFTVPNIQGRVQQKVDVTFPFQSDTGTVYVYRGTP